MCMSCLGDGKRVCRKCSGTLNAGCNKCGGTGDLSSYFASKPSNNCDKCKRKGILRCATCQKGMLACEPCESTGWIEEAVCEFCAGNKRALCSGCWDGSGRSWLETAEKIAAADNPERALAMFTEGMRREKARAVTMMAELEAESPERKRREKAWKKRMKQLERRLTALSKSARRRKQDSR